MFAKDCVCAGLCVGLFVSYARSKQSILNCLTEAWRVVHTDVIFQRGQLNKAEQEALA